MRPAPQVRLATASDAPAVARLSAEWGYPTSEALALTRLERVLSSPSHVVLVAEVDDTPAGWASAEVRLSLGSDPRVEITGLVVAAEFRRTGIGRLLVAHVEQWTAEKRCRELFLRSNVARAEAHPFYECLGYERTKTQHAYRKVLHAA